jgi:hypothetical protein
MSVADLTPCAKWTNDCQGKKDYDGRLIDISTRYWPAGGGFHMWDGHEFKSSAETRPHVRPSATASILLRHGEPDEYGSGDYLTLAERDFEGETEADVKAQVEAWVAEQFRAIAALVARHYGVAL